jgi:hypothetical protein
MNGNIHDLPKIADGIIIDLLQNQDTNTQENIEKATMARALMVEAVGLLHKVGIHEAGDGCEFEDELCRSIDYRSESGESADDYKQIPCENYEKCKKAHERFVRLLGGWTITNEAV